MAWNIKGKVCIVTGAAGLLGAQFSDALLEADGLVCLLDIDHPKLNETTKKLETKYSNRCLAIVADITDEKSIIQAHDSILAKFGRIDVLINNAANNPKVGKMGTEGFSRVENFKLEQWDGDIAVGLTGAFLCCKIFGSEMAKNRSGVIVNIASDLSVIAPDQRIYQDPSLDREAQPVKPVTYSVIKTGLLGLTRYLATYWADYGIRVNALSLGGVYTDQPDDFVKRLTNLIPMGRMATIDEYRDAILFLSSDASKYMTGQNLVIDGGRTIW
ncbi:MAG: SDR family oxidoreductase [Candidatus Methanoperedens sp.]